MKIRAEYIEYKKNFRLLILIVLTVIFAALTLTLKSCTNQEAKKLHLGMNDWPGYSLALYAKEAQLFAKRGLQVEIVNFNNQQDNIRATMRGAQELSFVTSWEILQVDPNEDSPAIIMIADISAGADAVVSQMDIESLQGLKGKKVATKLGTVAHLILLEALESKQMQPQAVEIVDVSNERGAELLEKSQVSAAVLWEPLLSKVLAKGKTKVLFDTSMEDSLIVDCLVTKSKNIQTYSTEITQFILAWFDAVHDLEKNPNQVFSAIAILTGQTPEAVAKSFAGIKVGDRNLNQQMFVNNGRLADVLVKSTQLLKKDLRHAKIIRDDVQISNQLLFKAIELWQNK
ncbi:MAG: ABC transporter substrate-binding protein [Pseudanabaenaceae cyanobacterium bins.39]|nr:ABC transporter substrate-binding protein [Pseudanabaenaceae cyanobacterium bins.39]